MRKFTLIIVSLLLTMSAMAQITNVSELSNNKCYQIRSVDAARGVFYAAENAEWLSTCGGTHNGYPNRNVAINIDDTKQQFALIQYEERYYLYSVSEKKFAVRASNGYIQLADTPDSYVTIEKTDNYFVIKMNGTNKLNLAMPQNAVAGVNANYETADNGNKLVITEAGEFNPKEALKAFPLKQQISLITGDLYRGVNATNAGTIDNANWCSKWQTKAENTPQITIVAKNYKNNIQKVNDTDFDFRGGDGSGNTTTYEISISEGYKITGYAFNYTKRQPAKTYNATVGINGTNNTVDTTTKKIDISGLDTNATEFTITDQNEGVLITNFYVYYKDLKEEARNELQRKIEQIIAWDQIFEIIGTEVGQLSSTNENFSYDLWDIMTFYSDESENATIEEIEEKIAEIEALTETLEVNMPVSGKAYTFKNVQADANHSTCWFKYDGTNIVLTTVKEEATVFICRELENGNYAFVNNAGKFLTWRGSDALNIKGVRDDYDNSTEKWSDLIITKMATGTNYDSGTDMTLTRNMLMQGRRESGSGNNAFNYYVIKWNNGNPIFDQANAPFYKQNLNNNGSFSSAIVIEDAEYANTPRLNSVGTSSLLTPDLHNKAMATFSAPFPTVLPDGVTAYYATEDKGDYVSIKPFESRTIPANTGVILVGEEAGNVTMVPAAGETPEAISNNLLSHSAGADLTFTTGYILSAMNGEAGFYKARAYGSSQHLAMNKAYIAIDAIQNSVNLRLFGTTSIENIEVENEDTAIYDLTGRRISEIAKPGIYIINGKKVTVK